MVTDVKRATLFLLLAYWGVTALVVGFIVALGVALHLPTAAELHVSVGRSPAYLRSMPFHPLLNLPVWALLGWRYLSQVRGVDVRREAWRLGTFWVLVSVVKDYLVWVLIPSPVQMTHTEMYVEYQPWLTLIYAVILFTPVAVARVMAARASRTAPALG